MRVFGILEEKSCFSSMVTCLVRRFGEEFKSMNGEAGGVTSRILVDYVVLEGHCRFNVGDGSRVSADGGGLVSSRKL